jgi:hypothetical protein
VDFDRFYQHKSLLKSKQFKHKVSILFWGTNKRMTDLKLAQMTKNLTKARKYGIDSMDWLKGLIDH